MSVTITSVSDDTEQAALVSTPAPQSEEIEVCRYCLEPEDAEPGGSLLQPCACRNRVHSRCFARWVFQSYRSGRADARCEVCRQSWSGELSVEMVTEQLAGLQAAPQGGAAEVLSFAARVADMQLTRLRAELNARREGSEAERVRAEADRDRAAARATTLYRTNQRLQNQVAQLRRQTSRRPWWWQVFVVGLPCTAVGLAAGALGAKALGSKAAGTHGEPPPGKHRRFIAGGMLSSAKL
ncbi:hypothetical protein D9Q98_006748 [Chlorella vulgaris]|uniref:RING-CH-type domain-containing protein n=1 Tax=Chlorella vulgaris TaxID=3077 RepID=A0A9D4YVD7_CHLVU|nr:hypothetical protein D9Q98_006748 [Chlorella vulgaris]